ncbi:MULTISPECIES: helix-turn-helix transcriptional regulator [unclassified Shinella]|uniref:helix-turn-helix domain-containing protein n=1 Tax=unclassified Shinella TaxID=2643062 RepID=UPI00225D03D1|nr:MULTISPECIES: helix-turn-helix transcriptional regulator [unclassified Shinella]MCO5140859.1 helix-turn-helix domain-containing protein [Shinella sp.]MDC7256452.1 helix-turn-helix domain-containing protein [Shinella sp. YE25]CAI0339320.1 hypothetical protein SHINE37_43174 [Rhizobiaceae bacterium]CAK7257727.1 HTH cro/C1-type domain-containing protein [Shinella sp. WSC3-e]
MNAHQSAADIIHLAPTTDGPIIRAAREANGWSQAFLAEKAGTSQQTVDRIERSVVLRSKSVLALKAILGIDLHVHAATTDIPARNIPSPSAKPTGGTLPKFAELRDEIETAFDLLTALDKTGDGIGGDVGHGVSAVALAARAALDNARDMLRAMEGTR